MKKAKNFQLANIKPSASGSWFLANFSLVLLIKVLLIKKMKTLLTNAYTCLDQKSKLFETNSIAIGTEELLQRKIYIKKHFSFFFLQNDILKGL